MADNSLLNINTYDYPLDKNLIAQTPIKNRDQSKLMVVNRKNGDISHHIFSDIINYLNKGDCLVLNDTKVIPARLFGVKEATKAHIEILLLKDNGNNLWDCLIRNSRRLKQEDIISFGEGLLKGKVISKASDGVIKLQLIYDGILYEILDKLGEMPLPPYIHKHLKEQDRYQTVYAKNIGSAAAPTAGLHFTKKLLDDIEKKGIIICYVTLHVGLGTFRPVEEDNILNHHMHSEYYEMTSDVAKLLNDAKESHHKIIAVGTTSTRVLETVYSKYNSFKESFGNTDIFIYPGYTFKAIDSLITNFHLPKSTLMMLVSAFSSKDIIMNAYREAMNKKYRFFSFGDAMLLDIPNYEKLLDEFKNQKIYLKKDNFKILKGTIPIMISVPHSKKHLRDGMVKNNEHNTARIAKLLYCLTNCHLIYAYKQGDNDHNYDESSNYKKKLKAYIKENNIKILIDIHGMADSYDIELGTNHYQNIFNDKDIINNIKDIFYKNNIKNVFVDRKFKAKRHNTISNYINKECNIKTIQLEIGPKYRKIKLRPKSFNKIIISLEEIINKNKE